MMKRIAIAAAIAGALSGPVQAEIDETAFKVVGTWGIGAMYQEHEAPMWNAALPEASGGKITGDIKAMTELGLKGFETIKLLKSGIFDAGFGGYVYIASGDAVFEGIDLAFAPNGLDEARKLVEAYQPVVNEAMIRIHGVKLLTSYPFPAQVMVCRDEFKSLADLEGRKIRVYSTTLGDMAEGMGGVSVTIPLPDVVPALQRGIVDCGVSSGVSMYKAKWHDVINYLYETPVSAGIAFLAMNKDKWDSLSPDTQALFVEQAKAMADKAWAAAKESEAQGIACLTGEGECAYGDPGNVTLVRADPADDELRTRILRDFVLKRFAARCGVECAQKWNETAGAVIGVEASE